MRILQVVPQYIPAWRYGGLVSSVHDLSKALVRQGHYVEVLTTDNDGYEWLNVPLNEPVNMDGVCVRYFHSRALRRICWAPELSLYIKKNLQEFDILHLHSLFLWPQIVAASYARRYNIPYVYSPHGMLEKGLFDKKNGIAKSLWLYLFGRKDLSGASAVHVTAERERKEISYFNIKLEEVVSIPWGVENIAYNHKSDSTNQWSLPSGEPLVLFMGRLNWKKGLDVLIPSMCQVNSGHLVIAGPDDEGYKYQLQKLVVEHRLGKRVSFIGPVYGDDKAELLSLASVFVLPSYSENFAIAALEAMAAGCPVVLSKEVGLAETIAQYDAGIVVPLDQNLLSDAINKIIDDPKIANIIGNRGKALALDYFGWPAIAKDMSSLYVRICGGYKKW